MVVDINMSARKAKANEILPGLWIGDEDVACDEYFFKKFKIKAVLNCTPDVPCKFAHFGIEYMRLSLDDQQKAIDMKKMKQYLPVAVEFIHKNYDLEKKNILINCAMGISRSSSSVLAYLMKYRNMSYRDGFKYIVSRRQQAFFDGKQCNFEGPLKEYEKSLQRK